MGYSCMSINVNLLIILPLNGTFSCNHGLVWGCGGVGGVGVLRLVCALEGEYSCRSIEGQLTNGSIF